MSLAPLVPWYNLLLLTRRLSQSLPESVQGEYTVLSPSRKRCSETGAERRQEGEKTAQNVK